MLLIIGFSIFSNIGNTQISTAEAEIQTLLSQRQDLINSSLSTLEVDKQLFNLGYRPKAKVTQIGNSISFGLFLPVHASKQAVMESRIKSVNPTLMSLTLNPTDQRITAVFSEPPSALNINDIITHFGFVGYEAY